MNKSRLFFSFRLLLFSLIFMLLFVLPGCHRSTEGPDGQDVSRYGYGTSAEDFVIGVIPFDPDTVLEYHITMEPALLDEMEQYGNDEVYRPAALHVTGGEVDLAFPEVGFRYKGGWSLHHCWDNNGGVRSFGSGCAHISTKIKFNEYDRNGRFNGLKRINLHALTRDDSKMHDALAYSVFRDFGVDAPRTAFAKLYINDEGPFLVLAVEQVDGRYTAHHYPGGGDGNLYKEIWPQPDWDDAEVLEHLTTNNDPEDNPDVSDFQGFGAAVGATTPETFAVDMEGWVDTTELLRYMAVDRALRNWDGITAFYNPRTPHNCYWYHDSGDKNIFHLIPWDLDNTMWEFDPLITPQQWVTADPIPNWNVKPVSCAPVTVWNPSKTVYVTPAGCDKLLNMLAATMWDDFVTIGNELLDTHLQYSEMNDKITKWEDQIRSVVEEDPHLDVDNWQAEVDFLRQILQDAIYDFADHLTEGYIVETPIVDPTQTELDAATVDTGFDPFGINNYEFSAGALDVSPAWVDSSVSTGSTITALWNEANPLSGNADLLISVDFVNKPGIWNEHASVYVGTADDATFDVTGYTQLSITMSADMDRTVRIYFRSPVYDTLYGGATPAFCSIMQVSAGTNVYKILLDSIYYPSWAKDDWGAGAGWTSSDGAARDEVLSNLNALFVQIYPQLSDSGEMILDNETVTLQIDNIYFQ